MTTGPSWRWERVNPEGLKPVGGRPPLGEYLSSLWRRRHFIVADSRARVSSTGRQMFLGQAWLVLKPVLEAAVYMIIFGLVLKQNRGIENFLGYLVIGVFLFQYTTRSLTSGGTAVINGKSLIHAFSFPRASLPIAVVIRETISMFPVLLAMVALILVIPPGAKVSTLWFLFPLVFILQFIFNFGIAMIAARLVAYARDVTHLLNLMARFWFYGSAVFFSYDRFIDSPTMLTFIQLNPLFMVLDMSRDLLLYERLPEITSWLKLSGWAAASFLIGLIFFWRGEETYGRDS